ncbi:hypothetical protein L6452_29409 [Arctium lappa]|uniref:Uncharacterized protein n=1 Tax=Arctium lappa TaxID=4217 RepID=A0ACB8ZGP8_ARCLA|nr:hypothetical protein L6452_29409 [Arctium lappa]
MPKCPYDSLTSITQETADLSEYHQKLSLKGSAHVGYPEGIAPHGEAPKRPSEDPLVMITHPGSALLVPTCKDKVITQESRSPTPYHSNDHQIRLTHVPMDPMQHSLRLHDYT